MPLAKLKELDKYTYGDSAEISPEKLDLTALDEYVYGKPTKTMVGPGIMERIHSGLRKKIGLEGFDLGRALTGVGKMGEKPSSDLRGQIGDLALQFLEESRERTIPTPLTEGQTSKEQMEIVVGNVRKQMEAAVRFPIDMAQNIMFDEKLQPRTPVDVIKQGAKVGLDFAQFFRQTFEDYSTYISPLASAEAKEEAMQRIAQEPLNLFFATGIAKGGMKQFRQLRQMFRPKVGTIPIAERVGEVFAKKEALTTETEFAKEQGKPSIFEEPKKKVVYGKEEMALAKKIKEEMKGEKVGLTPGQLRLPYLQARKIQSGKYQAFYKGTNNNFEIAGKPITKVFDTADEARAYIKAEWAKDQIKRMGITAKPAPAGKAPAVKEPWDMTIDELLRTGRTLEEPEVYASILKNEGPEALKMVKRLHEEGLGTLETHNLGTAIDVRIQAPESYISKLRKEGFKVSYPWKDKTYNLEIPLDKVDSELIRLPKNLEKGRAAVFDIVEGEVVGDYAADIGLVHEKTVRQALSEGKLSIGEYNRLHAKDSGPIEEFAPELAKGVEKPSPIPKELEGKAPKLNLTDKYLNEEINYGGEIRTRGSIIAEMQKEGIPERQIGLYMMGAKTLKGKPSPVPPELGGLESIGKAEMKLSAELEAKGIPKTEITKAPELPVQEPPPKNVYGEEIARSEIDNLLLKLQRKNLSTGERQKFARWVLQKQYEANQIPEGHPLALNFAQNVVKAIETFRAKESFPSWKNEGVKNAEHYLKDYLRDVQAAQRGKGEEGIVSSLTKAEEGARRRIKKRGVRLTTGIDPAEIADYAIIGSAKIAKGAIKFADWSVEMVKEFGDGIKPYLRTIYVRSQKEIPRVRVNAEIDSFIDYFEDIQAPKGFRPPRKPARAAIRERLREEGLTGSELTSETNAEFIKEVQDYGIALRQTKGGKVQPSIRVAGTYVPKDFAAYTEFKDAKAGVFGGTKDATRFIQEIDGALSVEAKAKLPGQAGPAEQYVLWRTRDITKSKLRWMDLQKSRLKAVSEGLSKEQTETANRVIEHIGRKGAYLDPAKLAKNSKISAITTDLDVIRFAQEGRKLYESLLRHQNELRRLRGQEEIPHRNYYTPHTIHNTTIWERALGHNKSPEQVVGPGLPDYIKPNAPFNPRAKARELGLPETIREMNLKMLLERYIETAAKDIYNTSIIQNNKAFIEQLRSMGYEHAARGLENWTAEAFGGVKSAVDRAANLSPTIHKGMNWFRRGLIRSVFPLNLAWNSFVQTSSGVLTVTRYGARNSIRGLYDWFANKEIRQEIADNAYSAIMKSQRSGRISRQDINRGVGAAERLNRGKLERASDATNFFTEWVERHLTGWSVATARRHGAKVGLKGKALWEYASDGGAKTQSMYNLEDLPGMLRSEVVKTGAPFQTFSFEVFNTLQEFAGKSGTPPATAAIRIKQVLRFLAGVTAVNYIGQAAIGRKPWELSSFIPFYGTLVAPVAAALKGEDISQPTTRGLPSPVGIAIEGGQATYRGILRPGFAAGKELVRTRSLNAAFEEFMATGKWDKLRRFTIRYLSGLAGVPGGTQINRVVDGLIAVSEGGMIDSADRMMFPITDTKDKMRSFLAGPWATKGGQEYWDKRGGELNVDIEFFEENPLLRDVAESFPVFGDFYKFKKASESQTRRSIQRMFRADNEEGAYQKWFEWNTENPDNKISYEWYSRERVGATP